MLDSFHAKSTLDIDGRPYTYARLGALADAGLDIAKLPFALKILLENLLRYEDGVTVTARDVRALASWDPKALPDYEIAFRPGRVLLQDFTGVPVVVDLAAMRSAMKAMGGDPARINPLQQVDLVIDHSVQVDEAGTPRAFFINAELEYQRNRERYTFLRWGQNAFRNFRVVPPETGIVHQVNLEYLAPAVLTRKVGNETWAFPDTLVGTDSHTTMINGLGVLGWGVGGIEAEAAMLGQPVSMLVPQVVGCRLVGKLAEGSTATDLVLTVTEILRKKGVVGKFVEFFGPGLSVLPLADRATIANMAPEYGATCGIFPIDAVTLQYLRLTGRSEEQVDLVEEYAKAQGLFAVQGAPEANYSDVVELDLATVEPSLAGPKRPQDRVPLGKVQDVFNASIAQILNGRKPPVVETSFGELTHGSVVIAAITSCTNTSNPSVMLAAGLLAKKAVEKGLETKPWVKASLAPGSKVVAEYFKAAGLTPYLEQLRFHLVGYGCATCIGNSGPLAAEISQSIHDHDLVAAAVLSGNRNFEGRVNPDVKANFLASPPLVVAYAIAGTMEIDLTHEPIGRDRSGKPVYLRDIWPSPAEVQETIMSAVKAEQFRHEYANVFEGDERWKSLPVPTGGLYEWSDDSTYVKHPPYFEAMTREPLPVADIVGARPLAILGDMITTDHISPAGSIKASTPAGLYLQKLGVPPKDFNSYGSRRGNHEIMIRGTFANIRLKNLMAPGTEGGVTKHHPSGEILPIYDAAVRYHAEGVPLVVLAGKEYGAGSSRDWAAKGTRLLGVRVVIAESFERIHRSNLVMMGVLPLQFQNGENAAKLVLSGDEMFEFHGLAEGLADGFSASRDIRVIAHESDGRATHFVATARIDTPQEVKYFQHGGILPFVLRQLLAETA